MDGLPDELTQHILSLVDDQTSETLWAFCLAYKALNRCATPMLYRKFSHRMYERPARLHSFLRTIMAKPELAEEVQAVELKDPERTDKYWDLDTWKDWAAINYRARLNDEDASKFNFASKLLAFINPANRSHVIENEQAQAALLLTLLPNLTNLLLDNPAIVSDEPRFHVNNRLLEIVTPMISAGTILHNLDTFVGTAVRLEGGQGGFRMSNIAPFFRLPKLKNVTLNVCHEPQDDGFIEFDCPPRLSNVTCLAFDSSAVCPVALSLVLGACKSLEVFECDWAGRIVGWVELNFHRLQEALHWHKDTLRRIYLDTSKRHEDWPESDEGLIPPLGDLRSFTELEEIDVPASAIIGWDEDDVGGFDSLKEILPPDIKYLRFNTMAPRLYEHLASLAEVVAEKYPKLKKITIVTETTKQMEDDLAKQFIERGTGVTVLIEEPS